MELPKVLPAIVARSGKSMQSISTHMGRSRTYVANVINRNKDYHVSTLSEIADVCGYDLMLCKRDGTDSITIDPPER